MKISPRQIASTTILALCVFVSYNMPGQVANSLRSRSSITVLNRDQASAIVPPSVFFRGQTASVQARNSAGLRFSTGKLVLAAMVDTSGYSSALQQTYQGYLLTEIPLGVNGQRLPPGAYGFGFVDGNRMVIMDIGGNEILHATTLSDAALARPTPLQIIEEAKDGPRLYLGRRYVILSQLEK